MRLTVNTRRVSLCGVSTHQESKECREVAESDKVIEQVDDLLMRVELLENRLSMLEDFIREQESQKEMSADPEAKRSFRHA